MYDFSEPSAEDVAVSESAVLPSGTRVHLRDHPFGVRLQSFAGYIVRHEAPDGTYIVHLDEPALYFDPDGNAEELPDIREAGDNLIVASSLE